MGAAVCVSVCGLWLVVDMARRSCVCVCVCMYVCMCVCPHGECVSPGGCVWMYVDVCMYVCMCPMGSVWRTGSVCSLSSPSLS